ncbi:MAG TPA: PilZ domain-containing protein [Terriglobales bacterium]|jgi:response regulator RpfG family c-di-GMP phosphodiesterase
MPTTTAVALQFLLVSDDHSTLKIVQTAFDSLGSNMTCSTSGGAALVYLSSHRVDGIILDLALSPALDVIASIRRTAANRRAFVFVCLPQGHEPAEALKGGANVVLRKPLDPVAIASSVKTFRGIMESERRRYFRHHVTIPVSLVVNAVNQRAMMENLSEGGMAVTMRNPLARSSSVEFSFELPFGPRVAGQTQVMWMNEAGMLGMEFRLFHGSSREHLVNWLKNKALQR